MNRNDPPTLRFCFPPKTVHLVRNFQVQGWYRGYLYVSRPDVGAYFQISVSSIWLDAAGTVILLGEGLLFHY